MQDKLHIVESVCKSGLSTSEKLVLISLILHVGEDGGCILSINKIACYCSLARRTVVTCLKSLLKNQNSPCVITRIYRQNNGAPESNSYKLEINEWYKGNTIIEVLKTGNKDNDSAKIIESANTALLDSESELVSQGIEKIEVSDVVQESSYTKEVTIQNKGNFIPKVVAQAPKLMGGITNAGRPHNPNAGPIHGDPISRGVMTGEGPKEKEVEGP